MDETLSQKSRSLIYLLVSTTLSCLIVSIFLFEEFGILVVMTLLSFFHDSMASFWITMALFIGQLRVLVGMIFSLPLILLTIAGLIMWKQEKYILAGRLAKISIIITAIFLLLPVIFLYFIRL